LANEQTQLEHLALYPNPTTGMLNFTNDQPIDQVEIYNMLGQLVAQQNLHAKTGTINMTQLSAGTYLVKVQSSGLAQTMRIVKE
jgi:hypothetical protein